MSNPFLDYKPPGRRPMRAKVVTSDAAAPLMPTPMEKAERDKSLQMRRHNEYWREQLDVARHGEFGIEIIELEKFLKRMKIDDGEALIDHVKRWRFRQTDIHTRYMAMRLVGNAIERLRVQNGLPPFDDSLPDEPPTVFEIIRMELGVP